MAISTFIHDKEKGKPQAGWPDVIGYGKLSFEGCVLATYEENGYDDSDFNAVVWDEAEQKVQSVTFASTRGWTYLDGASVDATDEVRAKAKIWLEGVIFTLLSGAEHSRVNEPFGEVDRGTRLELTRDIKHKKVKYEKGLKGNVFWKGHYGTFYRNGYKRPGRENCRVGLRLDETGDKVFVALGACKLDDQPKPESELRETAHRLAQNEAYVSAVRGGQWLF